MGCAIRQRTVPQIGCSTADPVFRYMMDALAADRLPGKPSSEMFAFGSCSRGEEEYRANKWRVKKLTPIPYKDHRRHAYLHKTLNAWATTITLWGALQERIIVKNAIARPLASTKEDDFVSLGGSCASGRTFRARPDLNMRHSLLLSTWILYLTNV